MQNALKAEIKRLCRKAFARAERESQLTAKYQKQFEKRTGTTAGAPKKLVKTAIDRHFDPIYCSRNANFLAKVIWFKILNNEYNPRPAVNYQIPKPDGSHRGIMAFTIPDAAVANVFLRRVRRRNLKRLSPSSFAYHPDKNVFDAILTLKEFDPDGKLFAVQIDFEKFFDTIPHSYIKSKLDDSSLFSLTPHEKYVFSRFLKHQFATLEDYQKGNFSRKFVGTPQGSSVSLILSNIANHDLDVSLSNQAGKFVRFADDVVALCSNYEQAQLLEEQFARHCRESGLIVSVKKSPGIAIIAKKDSELRTYSHFDYLGYRFTPDGLCIPAKTISRIKSKISRLVHIYLIMYLSFGFNKSRSSVSPHPYDWDLLGCIYEIRNAIYGGLTSRDLRLFIDQGVKPPRMKGLMGFYCLLEQPDQLRELDGWLLSTLRRAMVVRNKTIQSKYGRATVTPSNQSLATGTWLDQSAWRNSGVGATSTGNVDDTDNNLASPDPKAPSFLLGWRAARKYYFTFGLEDVQAPNYGGYATTLNFEEYI